MVPGSAISGSEAISSRGLIHGHRAAQSHGGKDQHHEEISQNRAGEESQDQLDLPGADGGKDDYQEELEQ